MCAGSHQHLQVVAESYKCLQKRHVRRNDLTQVSSGRGPPALIGIKIREAHQDKL